MQPDVDWVLIIFGTQIWWRNDRFGPCFPTIFPFLIIWLLFDYDYFKITSWFIDVICNHSDCIKISILLKMNFKNFMYKLLRNVFKGNTQFIFLFHPQKSGTSEVRITFLQLTQKIQTKDIFHWLELITEILSFLQIFSVRKITTQLF